MSNNLSNVVPSRKKRLFMDGSVADAFMPCRLQSGASSESEISKQADPHGLICLGDLIQLCSTGVSLSIPAPQRA